ncbi:nudix hydrolase 18, mitochondrial-like isoform X1 [Hibiscus syriacus]|uniref:nudix hydrolase 18, mitochondrial-like isoform X1 n=1 Tax=Hibiscus syriacus TaxID=106335 RepID=UPI001921159A|nr:nudix hydrolase 18, mitochondrial-like isoform X1 [Hibiscus syriacus]
MITWAAAKLSGEYLFFSEMDFWSDFSCWDCFQSMFFFSINETSLISSNLTICRSIPYRYKSTSDGTTSNDLEVLVISSQKCQKMMFPKGGWELDESREEAALRESLEEAGVLGIVECELGKWDFISKRHGTFYEGYMFPLLVKEELDFWPEQNLRQRTWMNVEEARDVCQHWWMKEALDILVQRLNTVDQQNEQKFPNLCTDLAAKISQFVH